MQCSHESFSSSMDKHGNSQTLSIDAFSAVKKPHIVIYKAKLRSRLGFQDSRDGSIVHAMFPGKMVLEQSEDWAIREVRKSEIAQHFADIFNNTIRHLIKTLAGKISNGEFGNRNVEFQVPQTAQLESVSCMDRSRKKDEYFIIMDRFKKGENFVCSSDSTCKSSHTKKKCHKSCKKSNFFNFTSTDGINKKDTRSHGRKRSSSEGDPHFNSTDQILHHCVQCFGQCNDKRSSKHDSTSDMSHPYLHAFVHYFYCQHDGNMAIDCLQGEYDETLGYKLSTPVIHSRQRQFGFHDRGVEGIRQVTQSHVCNDLCKHLPKMTASTSVDNTECLQLIFTREDVQPPRYEDHDFSSPSNVHNYNDPYSNPQPLRPFPGPSLDQTNKNTCALMCSHEGPPPELSECLRRFQIPIIRLSQKEFRNR